MKLTLRKKSDDRSWPGYIGGRMRTSTVGLIVAFFLTAWLYETYQPPPTPAPLPANQVVPPGYVPDPEYTWVPRTSVRQYPQTSTEVPRPTTTTTTPTTTTTTPTTTETTPTTTEPTTTPTTAPGLPNPFLPFQPSPTPAPPSSPPGFVPTVPPVIP